VSVAIIKAALGGEIEAQSLRAKKGQLVFHRGDPSDSIYLLVEGEVRSFIPSSHAESREQTSLLSRGPALLGDRDILAGISARESVVCLTPARFLAWDAEHLVRGFSESEALRGVLARDLATRYARALEQAALQQAPLPHRLAMLLWALQGMETPSIPLLAILAGATPKSITRARAQLRESGVLQASGVDGRELDLSAIEAMGIDAPGPLFHSLELP